MCWRLIICIAALLLQGCAQQMPKEQPVVRTAAPKPVVAPVKAKPVEAKQVVILVSADIPAYSEVATSLAEKLGKRGSIRYLTASRVDNLKLVAEYQNDDHKQIVAIGLGAAVAAKSLPNRQVIFCQVFNYHDYDLLTHRHKGVSMVPSPYKIFSIWHALAPNTTDIGMISGPGFEDLIQIAKTAAKNNGMRLHTEIVGSDKEYQYAYKQMAGSVQGYLLIPDNRVLSGNTLRSVMTFSVRNSKQVAVFSDELLKLGGLFSAGSNKGDIAQQVFNRLEEAQTEDPVPGADIVYATKLNLRINSVMAKRLTMPIPKEYRNYRYEPW